VCMSRFMHVKKYVVRPSRLRKKGEFGAFSPRYFCQNNEAGALYRVGTR
jgi:hypothetical protein